MKALRYLTASVLLVAARAAAWVNRELSTAALGTVGLRPVMGAGNLGVGLPNIFGGAGAPGAPSTTGNTQPSVGDVYFRTDTPGTVAQRIYVCTVGGATPTWVATAA
jgi:hypothetical protein